MNIFNVVDRRIDSQLMIYMDYLSRSIVTMDILFDLRIKVLKMHWSSDPNVKIFNRIL